ncbi:MAG: efflux RND transporter periplasmic adaptor subunit [Oceanococcus sp.]
MSSRSTLPPAWIAGGIFVLVSLWLASGMFFDEDAVLAESESSEAIPKVRVRVMDSAAQDLTREALSSARTAPVREVTLRAEQSGRLTEILVERGQQVRAGELIARLDTGDRLATMQRAKALRDQRELEIKAAQRLHKQSVISDVELAGAHSNLLQAKAEWQKAKTALDNCEIRAPFDGVLETRKLDIGHYSSVGDEFGHFIQQQPFLVKAQVPEDVIVFLKTGQSARARLPDGREVDGLLRYVATQADAGSRTYPVELEVRGLAEPVIAGGSAVLMLPLELVRAHVLQPSSLALNDAGEFGVKAVNDQGVVEFHSARIAQANQDEIWLTGLPEMLRIITVGQGFVSTGDVVEPVVAGASEPEA